MPFVWLNSLKGKRQQEAVLRKSGGRENHLKIFLYQQVSGVRHLFSPGIELSGILEGVSLYNDWQTYKRRGGYPDPPKLL